MSSACVFSPGWLFAMLWTVACQTLLSMGFSRQNYWSRLPFHTLGDLPHLGVKLSLLCLLYWQVDYYTISTTWEAQCAYVWLYFIFFRSWNLILKNSLYCVCQIMVVYVRNMGYNWNRINKSKKGKVYWGTASHFFVNNTLWDTYVLWVLKSSEL